MRLPIIYQCLLSVLILCLLTACSQQFFDEARERQREAQELQAAQDKSLIDTTKVGVTPGTLKNCQAAITAVGNKDNLRVLTSFAIAPDAVRYIGNGVYGTFDKRTYERLPWTAIVATCEYENLLSIQKIGYCGCAYQIKDGKLSFVRVLSPAEFLRQR